MKIKIIILIFFSFLLSQAEYQILTTPQNIYELSTHKSSPHLDNNTNYSFSLIQYPAAIKMYNFRIKNYNISVLDYILLDIYVLMIDTFYMVTIINIYLYYFSKYE